MTRATLVEFLGLPGVGKSTVSANVAQHLLATGHRVREPSRALAHGPRPLARRLRKSGHMLRELLSHPGASLQALRAITASAQRGRLGAPRLFANWLLVLDLVRQSRRGSGFSLLDQGVLQAVWSVALDGDADAALRLLDIAARHGLLPELAVVVEATIDSVRQRLSARPRHDSRVERDPARLPELLARGEQILQRVHVAVERLGHTRIVVLGNGELADPQAVVADVIERIGLSAAVARPLPG